MEQDGANLAERIQSAGSYLHVFRCVAQQAAKGDGVGDSSQVNEQYGRQGLDVNCVSKVTKEERRFSFDV